MSGGGHKQRAEPTESELLRAWNVPTVVGGSHILTNHLDAITDVTRVVDMVDEVLRTKEELFTIDSKGNRMRIRQSVLGRRFRECLRIDFDNIASGFPRHRMSPFYIAFEQQTQGLRHLGGHLAEDTAVMYNDAADKLRELASKGPLRRALTNLYRCEGDNAQAARDLLQSMREHHSKVLAIRLDLGYYSDFSPECGVRGQGIEFEEVKSHRDAFLKHVRRGPFKGRVAGYVWKMEFGIEKGYHLHVAVFLDGQKVCKDITIGSLLGNTWKEITGGRGIFYNCNQSKHRYKQVAVGMLQRGDDEKWAALQNAMRYLTKVDHYIRFQAPRKSKTFGVGGVYSTKR